MPLWDTMCHMTISRVDEGNAVLAGSRDGTAWMWLSHNGQCVQVFDNLIYKQLRIAAEKNLKNRFYKFNDYCLSRFLPVMTVEFLLVVSPPMGDMCAREERMELFACGMASANQR